MSKDISDTNFYEAYINHFWMVNVDKHGSERYIGKIHYDKLVEYYDWLHPHISCSETGIVYTYNGKFYKKTPKKELNNFVIKHLDPFFNETNQLTLRRDRHEFTSRMEDTNLKSVNWFDSHLLEGKINLNNGVYDILRNELVPHDSSLPFRYCLNYNYDPQADCPKFEKFLMDITLNRTDLINIIMEYLGYCIVGGDCYAQKALFCHGTGQNGKSTFTKIVKAVLGDDNCSNLSLSALNSDTKRLMVDGKLVNIGEETSPKALVESEFFKTMVTGGEIDVKQLYVQDFTIKNRCKLIVLCNEMPRSNDTTEGLYRRVLPVPFNAVFKGSNDNKNIADEIIAEELPGILNHICFAYKRLKANDWNFTYSDAVEEELRKYKALNDSIYGFIQERLHVVENEDLAENTYVLRKDVWGEYVDFCKDANMYPMGKIRFFDKFIQALPSSQVTQRRIGEIYKTPQRVITGISWK